MTQPCSAPSSPLASPGALSSTSFCMPTAAAAAAAAATSTASASGSSGFSGSVSSTSSSSSSSCSVGGVSSSSCFMHHNSFNPIDTADPNWQATKSSVRERNAAMFNNDLMADISFIVGSDGEWCSAPQWLSAIIFFLLQIIFKRYRHTNMCWPQEVQFSMPCFSGVWPIINWRLKFLTLSQWPF